MENNNNNDEHSLITEAMLDSDIIKEGFDSLLFIHLIVIIEEKFDCEISEEKLLLSEMNTINQNS